MHEKLVAKMVEVQNKLEKFGYAKLPLRITVVKLRRGAAGTAYSHLNLIGISPDYLREHPDHVFNVTVAHEVCHHYVWKYKPHAKQNHGPEFRSLMRLLGLNGDTYHKLSLENAPKRPGRKKIRFVYETMVTGQKVKLTKNQHQKMVASNGAYSYRGEKLRYTNIIEEIL